MDAVAARSSDYQSFFSVYADAFAQEASIDDVFKQLGFGHDRFESFQLLLGVIQVEPENLPFPLLQLPNWQIEVRLRTDKRQLREAVALLVLSRIAFTNLLLAD